ncbi:MAG TPA: glutamine amidotransferase [Bryobacteraceae bacterium]|nr:glutamine amidotransferase [Bryobacteraceae bacterium]
MFEFLFKYPSQVFSRGTFVFAGAMPTWLLIAAILAAAGLLGWMVQSRSKDSARVRGWRSAGVWILQSALATLLLLMLWHPALSVATLRPQQNIVAVVVDDSASMATQDEGGSRSAAAVNVLNSGLMANLQKRFQVRLYRLSDQLTRIQKLDELKANGQSTHIGESLKGVLADASSLPIGAVVLLTDGADNSGGIDLETISEIRRQRIPIHTIGFGLEKAAHDVELSGVQIPPRAMPDSRLPATVSFHSNGYAGDKAKITLRDGAKVLASREVTLKNGDQTEQIMFNTGSAGVRTVEAAIDPLPGESNLKNNQLTRLVNVDSRKAKILYMEGEPRWEFKFLRRAIEDDHNLHLSSILRTTQNKIYVQDDYGDAPKSIKDGFPTKVDDLFAFDGLIIGSSEAAYFSPAQQDMIHQFVDRRGGGLLFLGGKDALADGDYKKSALNDLLPVTLPDKKGTFVRAPANVELTAAGRDSSIVRIEEDPDKNAQKWKKMPYLLNFQNPGQPKPGATVLMDSLPVQGGRLPLLIIENFGRGRTAVFATGGSWRGWQMQMPVSDKTHEMFYTQLLRWLVNDTPKRVTGSTPRQVIEDEAAVKLRAEVRDHTYLPAGDATVEGHILGPEGIAETVEMTPDPVEAGVYTADYTTPKPGSYLVEMLAKHGAEEIGRDVLTFRREDGVAENFHVEQNRELLEKLSSETGGRYYTAEDAKKLGGDISYSEAGITVRETKDLWDMPVVFLALLLIRSTEWLLRRKWGVI